MNSALNAVLLSKLVYFVAILFIVWVGAYIIKRTLAYAAKSACHQWNPKWESRLVVFVPLFTGLCCVIGGLVLICRFDQ